jgi:multidrug efflux pump subunit AcrB
MSTDIFPNINIPVVSVIWSYPGVGGTAKYLFQPLAMAVIFAMLASYLLSRTVIPTMVKFLLRGAHGGNRYQPRAQLEHFGERTWPAGRIRWVAGLFHGGEDFAARRRKGLARPVRFPAGFLRTFRAFFSSVHNRFNRVFEKIRDRDVEALHSCLNHRGLGHLTTAVGGGKELASQRTIEFYSSCS